jgi:membrane protein YqaA with SNARE-associated domain
MAFGYLGIFALMFIINLVPFASPSNMVMAGLIVILIPQANPVTIASITALSASAAKILHYYTAYFLGSRITPHHSERFSQYRKLLHRWAMLGVFLAAASPIPDDPVVIPLGLMRYSVIRFFASYLVGKLLVCLAGAYTARYIQVSLETFTGRPEQIALSILLSILALSIIIKSNPSSIQEWAKKQMSKLRRTKEC